MSELPKGRALNWRITEDEKVILICSVDGKEYQIDIPIDIVKQLIVDMPPCEETKIRELIDGIHKIRKERVLELGEIDKSIEEVNKDNNDAISALKSAPTKLDVARWIAIVKANGNKKQLLTERRHLVRLSYQEEGELSLKLRQLMQGSA